MTPGKNPIERRLIMPRYQRQHISPNRKHRSSYNFLIISQTLAYASVNNKAIRFGAPRVVNGYQGNKVGGCHDLGHLGQTIGVNDMSPVQKPYYLNRRLPTLPPEPYYLIVVSGARVKPALVVGLANCKRDWERNLKGPFERYLIMPHEGIEFVGKGDPPMMNRLIQNVFTYSVHIRLGDRKRGGRILPSKIPFAEVILVNKPFCAFGNNGGDGFFGEIR